MLNLANVTKPMGEVRLDANKTASSGVRRADVTGFGVPQHDGDGSALPRLVQ